MSTTSRDQVMDFILEDIGPDTIEEYQVHCAAEVLAEATVGVVLPCTLVLPGETRVRQAVAKVIKPYAMSALQEELEIFDRLARYFAEYSDSYAVGTILISDMFDEISVALSQEIQVVDEQQNLAKAGAYYLANERVRVPELYPLSTAHVTFMEFVHGHKISEAFPGQPQARARLARRLVDALTLDVLLSQHEEALFHGDPHAGNVFHVQDDPQDPYVLALLDWGLSGEFSREQRAQLMQLLLGVRLNHAKRLRTHMGALIEGDEWATPDGQEAIGIIVAETLAERGEGRIFGVYPGFPTIFSEPYRVCRRAFSLRGWSHVTTESVFPRSTRASGAAGPRARG